MDYKSSLNAYKMFAIILVIFICVDAITAAPLPEESSTKSPKPRTPKNHRRKGIQGANGKKSLDRRKNPFTDLAQEWQNACVSKGWTPGIENVSDFNASYESIKVIVRDTNTSIAFMDKINTTEIETWEFFNNDSYSFLKTRPTGNVHKWHEYTQIYLASFSLLHKYQHQEDKKSGNTDVSQELKDIVSKARQLLCDIEHFVNATSNKSGKYKPYWFSAEEMSGLVKLRKDKGYINNIFVKARFKAFLDRLYKRILHFNLEKNLEPKSLKSHRTMMKQRRKQRNQNAKRRSTTPSNVIIVRTSKIPRKNNKNQNKKNIIN